ncbi:MAG: pyridoxal phosphate-dependent aminotransferase [Bacillota bacterium]|nr:pyridoxal phosphate-dependent aminotransferase [Bacillota bacterium]
MTSALFADNNVKLDLLRRRAFNGRWAMQAPDVIPLTAADPDFPAAPEIRAAIKGYVDDGLLGYGPAEGLPEFKETMARVVAERKGIGCTPGLILPTDSAAAGMFLIARHALEPGDEAIIFDPVDFLFGQAVDAAGGKRVYSPVDKAAGTFDLGGLRRLITPRTRMICVCNPHNPLGRVMTGEELLQIGRLAVDHGLTIMSDEIWSDIVYPPHRHTSMAGLSPEIAERTITVFGLSKTFGLAGLRIGFLVAPTAHAYERLAELSRVRTTAAGVTTLSQVAAVAAYRECWYWVDAFLTHLREMRDYVVGRLNAIPGVDCRKPEGTYVVFPDITGLGMDSQKTADCLLEQARVAVVPGLPRWFGPGAEGNIRLCFSTSRGILTEALDRIERALRGRGKAGS